MSKRFSLFKPRLPRVSGLGDTTASSVRWAKSTFKRSGAACPSCGGKLEILDIIEEETQEVTRSLVCQECGQHEPIDQLIDQAASQINTLRDGERTFFFSGTAVFTVFAAISFLNSDLTTFLGGAVFSLILMMRGFVFRYRAWQCANKKLYLDRPPIREWLADEFSDNDS